MVDDVEVEHDVPRAVLVEVLERHLAHLALVQLHQGRCRHGRPHGPVQLLLILWEEAHPPQVGRQLFFFPLLPRRRLHHARFLHFSVL
jgi:RecG-like helicase